MNFIQTRKVKDYKPIFEGFTKDWGYIYYETILYWCRILNDDDTEYWQLYLIQERGKTIGMCALYSQYEDRTDELWLGWFGILPHLRNKGKGAIALNWMKKQCKKLGCTKLMSYVDKDGKPLPFYYRNGFKLVSTVEQYLKKQPELDPEAFEDMKDVIIECNL